MCSLLRAEGFYCSFDVLYGGLGISINCNFDQKNIPFFPAVNFSHCLVIWVLIVFNLKCWIRIWIQLIWILNTAKNHPTLFSL
jgi:hypothetical protein